MPGSNLWCPSRLTLTVGWISILSALVPATAHAAAGDLDRSFSGDGIHTISFGGDESASALAIQSDGKIITAGRGSTPDAIAIARFDPDGSLDSTFSDDGMLTLSPAGGAASSEASGVALQPDGKIIVAGGGNGDSVLVRLEPDGRFDSTFSGDGVRSGDLGGFASAVLLQADGRIVVAGTTGQDFGVVRYNADGTLDNTFSDDGRQTTDVAGVDRVTGATLQTDGKVVVVGTTETNAWALVRYNPDGSLDTTLSGDGKQTTPFPPLSDASDVAVQSTGKIVVVGQSSGNEIIARYTTDGSLDGAFSEDGKQTTDFGGTDRALGVAVQTNDRLVVVGISEYGTSSDLTLARYTVDGGLDTSFSGDGKTTGDFRTFDIFGAVALQDDGNLVIAGSLGGMSGSPAAGTAIARYVGDLPSSPPPPPPAQVPSPPPASPAPPPPATVSPSAAPPAASPQPSPVLGPSVLGEPPFASKLEVARARVLRSDRRLSVLAPITGRASGEVQAAFQAAGSTERFTAEVDASKRRVRIDRRIPAAQARLGTGILTLTYKGDENTQPQEVRLRAASRRASLDANRPKITGNRLTASGTISKKARGVVRLQVLYEPEGMQTRTLTYTARIKNGRYAFDQRLPDDVVAEIAKRRGVVHSYTLFTGYFPRRVRGEMRSYQVLGER